MARRYLTADNSRHGEVTAANPSYVHIRGWNAGVEVRCETVDGKDAFAVYLTHGSNGSGSNELIGAVIDMDTGPVWCRKPVKE